MSIDLGNAPVGTPPTPTEQTQLRTSFGLGAADTVEFGGFVPPSGTTAEIDSVTDAVVGQVMINSDSGQLVRFTGAATYEAITSNSYVPAVNETLGAALTLAETRLFESGVFAGSPDVNAPTDLLNIYSSKNPTAGGPTSYLYHTGEQGPAGWYDINDIGSGVITSAVFTPDSLMRLQLGANRTPFVTGNHIINTNTPVELSSAAMKAGSTYDVEFFVSFVDLLGSNASIDVDYSGSLGAGGFLMLRNDDAVSGASLLQLAINSPEMPTSATVNVNSFAGKAGSTFGSWTVKGQFTPSSDGTLTIGISTGALTVEPLFYAIPTTSVTLLT